MCVGVDAMLDPPHLDPMVMPSTDEKGKGPRGLVLVDISGPVFSNLHRVQSRDSHVTKIQDSNIVGTNANAD